MLGSQAFQNLLGVWVDGWVCIWQEIISLRGSILQAGICQIFSLAENPRWSRVWQLSHKCEKVSIFEGRGGQQKMENSISLTPPRIH